MTADAAELSMPQCDDTNQINEEMGQYNASVQILKHGKPYTAGFRTYTDGSPNERLIYYVGAVSTGEITNDGNGNLDITRSCITTDGHLMFQNTLGSAVFLDEGIVRFYFTSYYIKPLQEITTWNGANNLDNGVAIITNYQNAKIYSGQFVPVSRGVASFDVILRTDTERYLTLDANGGAWADGSKTDKQTVDINYKELTDDRPTRDGYVLTGWNTKPDGTGDDASNLKTGLKDNQTIYAVWSKDPGSPKNVQIDCSPRKAGGVLCSVMAYYNGAPVQKRELSTSGTENLSWSGNPISGVVLNGDGYAADMSCTTRGDDDSQCYYASLEKEPANTGSYQAQMPTTGAPEGLSAVGLAAVGLGLLGLSFALVRRSRS